VAGVDGVEGGGCGEWREFMTWIDELNGTMMQFEVLFLRNSLLYTRAAMPDVYLCQVD
jgi:hypothetical protein